MGTCACFYAQKLQNYKELYPVSTKLQSDDPRRNDPQFLRSQIQKLDYIIKHQNLQLSKLQNQTQKLRKHPRNKIKVLNNSKKLFLMTKNGTLCKTCIQTYDTNKLPIEQLVMVEGLCAKCKGDGLNRQLMHVKSKQCGKCDRFCEYLWRIEMCQVCNGVGMLYTEGYNPYAGRNEILQPGTNQALVKKY